MNAWLLFIGGACIVVGLHNLQERGFWRVFGIACAIIGAVDVLLAVRGGVNWGL